MAGGEVAEMPKVCCRYAMFADYSGVQKWQFYLKAVELLAVTFAKDKKRLKASLDDLRSKLEAF